MLVFNGRSFTPSKRHGNEKRDQGTKHKYRLIKSVWSKTDMELI